MADVIRPDRERPGLLIRISESVGGRPLEQLGLLFGVLLLFAFLTDNGIASMAKLGIAPGFGFLSSAANFEIGESLIPYSAGDTYGRAILVGLLNTVLIAVCGCILATVLGTLLGIARLSGNLLLAGFVQGYVEIVRNTPLLLQLFFWSVTIRALPGPRQALSPFAGAFLSNRGIFILAPGGPLAGWLLAALLAALLLGALALTQSSELRRRRIGQGAAAFAGLAVLLAPIGWATGGLALSLPVLKGFNITGGTGLSPEFATLLVGLVVNTSAGIAEIVRSGIQSVARGQWEAGSAIGLSRGQLMRLVILPQAMRVITPMLTSSYLDLTKNSSLAVAIGYPDLVSVVNTTANTTGQSTEALAILVAVYLALNLSVSAVMNRYNRTTALRGMHPR